MSDPVFVLRSAACRKRSLQGKSTVDREMIGKNVEVFSAIAKLVKKSWEIGG
jgi:hypothetical protein